MWLLHTIIDNPSHAECGPNFSHSYFYYYSLFFLCSMVHIYTLCICVPYVHTLWYSFHLLSTMPIISPYGKGLYLSFLLSSLVFILEAFSSMVFIQNFSILNNLTITGRTKEFCDMLHLVNRYCHQSTYKNHTHLTGRMSWVC